MKFLLHLTVFLSFASLSHAQESNMPDVPAAIQKAFQKSNPAITSPEWKQSGDSYTAVYTDNQLERSITYTSSGKLQVIEEQVTLSQLPTEILKYINENHPDGIIKKARKIKKSGGKYSYSINIKGLDLLFDAHGNYLNPSYE